MMTSNMAQKVAQETAPEVIEDARCWLLEQIPGHSDVVAGLSAAEVIYWTSGYYGGWNEFVTARRRKT